MATPKHRVSKHRRDKRRAHDALTATSLSTCPQCGAMHPGREPPAGWVSLPPRKQD